MNAPDHGRGIRVERRCPRCNVHRNHHVEVPTPLPARAPIVCAECGHRWTGRLTRDERELPPVARRSLGEKGATR